MTHDTSDPVRAQHSIATTPPDADPSAIREAIDAATAAPANDLPPRYRITVVAAARSNPGRAVGAYVVRLGTRTRLVAVEGVGIGSTHRAVLVTIAAALRADRGQRLAITLVTNQQSAIAGINSMLRDGLCSSVEMMGIRDAVVAAGVPVDFVFKANGSGDVDLTAAREAAAAIISSRARPS